MSELNKPNTVMEGYKWIADKAHDVYIVKLKANNAIQKNPKYEPFEYCSSDCVVMEIRRFRDGAIFPRVEGGAYFPYTYYAGQSIGKPDIIYFCKSIDDLMKSERGGIKYS